jgi:hypothetical protein
VSALSLAALFVAPAGATTVTIGQVAPVGTTGGCNFCTIFQKTTASTSPSYAVPAGNWTITSWSAEAGTMDSQARLRVFRPGPAGDEWTLVAESTDQTIPANTSGPFATSIPVQGGELIGIRTSNTPGDISPVYPGQPGDNTLGVSGDPPVGATACGAGSMFTCGTSFTPNLVNIAATLFAPPSNVFTFGKVKDNKKNGTATLAVNVPGPGILSLTGDGVKHQRSAGATASQVASAAGTVKLAIKPKTKIKKKLKKRGKAKVKVNVAYTPTGGFLAKQSERVKLVERH